MHESLEQILVETSVRLHRKAIQDGIAIGRVKGAAKILRLQLAARFHVLDEASIARVRTARPDQLACWAIAVFLAPTLAAVFATTSPVRRGQLAESVSLEDARKPAADGPREVECMYRRHYGRHLQAALREGIAAGRVEAGVEVLLRQLAVRFGVADDETARRVHAAALDEVERWAIAILSAPTLAAMFATG